MKNILFALTALAAVSTALPVTAQSNNRGPVRVVVANQPSQQALDLATRVINLTLPDFEKQLNEFVGTVSRELDFSSYDPQMAAWFEKNAGPMMLPHMRTLLNEMAGLYAEQMSIAEMEAIIGFYETPMGQEIARKQVKLQLDLSMPMARMQENYARDLMTEFCKQFDCGAAMGGASEKPVRR